ncbi:MAG: hypothetical protein WDN31_22410 [Hyphomicrobium sp.]
MSPTSAAIRRKDDSLRAPLIAGAARTPAARDARAGVARLDYSIVTTRAEFDSLAADWDGLFARAGRGRAGVPVLRLVLALVQSLPRRGIGEAVLSPS